MTFDYTRSRATANGLITKFGQAGVIRRITRSSSGPAHNPGVPTTTDYDAIIVVLDYRNSDIDGTRIKRGDKRVLVAVSDLEISPDINDKVVVAGTVHDIVSTRTVSPGGTVVLWELQARA